MKKSLLTISILLLTVPSVWAFDFLYHSDGPYKGQVIDLEIGEPIEGAVVAGVWEVKLLYVRLSDPLPRFCDAEEAITDKNGEFILPKVSCFTVWPIAKLAFPKVVVFKPGYLAYPPLGATYEERKAQMPGFTGDEFREKNQYNIIKLGKPKTKEERELTHDEANTPLRDEAMRKLSFLIKLINEDRKNLELIGTIGPVRNGGKK